MSSAPNNKEVSEYKIPIRLSISPNHLQWVRDQLKGQSVSYYVGELIQEKMDAASNSK